MLCAQLKFHLDNILIYVSVLNKYDYLLNPDTILHLFFFPENCFSQCFAGGSLFFYLNYKYSRDSHGYLLKSHIHLVGLSDYLLTHLMLA